MTTMCVSLLGIGGVIAWPAAMSFDTMYCNVIQINAAAVPWIVTLQVCTVDIFVSDLILMYILGQLYAGHR